MAIRRGEQFEVNFLEDAKRLLANNLTAKGQTSVNTEALLALIAKVTNISSGGMSLPDGTSLTNLEFKGTDKDGNKYYLDLASSPWKVKKYDSNFTLLQTFMNAKNVWGANEEYYVNETTTGYEVRNYAGTVVYSFSSSSRDQGVPRKNDAGQVQVLIISSGNAQIFNMSGTILLTVGRNSTIFSFYPSHNRKGNYVLLEWDFNNNATKRMIRIDKNLVLTTFYPTTQQNLLAFDIANW